MPVFSPDHPSTNEVKAGNSGDIVSTRYVKFDVFGEVRFTAAAGAGSVEAEKAVEAVNKSRALTPFTKANPKGLATDNSSPLRFTESPLKVAGVVIDLTTPPTPKIADRLWSPASNDSDCVLLECHQIVSTPVKRNKAKDPFPASPQPEAATFGADILNTPLRANFKVSGPLYSFNAAESQDDVVDDVPA